MADPGLVTDGKAARPDLNVLRRARRRTFSAKYKVKVLAAYEAARPGVVNAAPNVLPVPAASETATASRAARRIGHSARSAAEAPFTTSEATHKHTTCAYLLGGGLGLPAVLTALDTRVPERRSVRQEARALGWVTAVRRRTFG